MPCKTGGGQFVIKHMILKLGFYLLLCNQLPFLQLELIGLFYFRQYNNNLSDEKKQGEKSPFLKGQLGESTRYC